ncbi:PucR C-terminal helix-turn-helix domain-containing protein [Amycolatopsis arida]|uniref:PucR C-terminal helix-turn-helix domain-containing protein n=1 Tax=Amycolatopsis arida TaxID=587909 RepID=A0A1I5SMB0_9PSEU|nr:helix-turn-helix domain-containing protein [Amycolatopsis arida]TDX96425.1 PucR-like helix-turn-helix protein [Amycolatopsis arida]SFP71893.1 PucR C-terminal helix-turn-helix domain-containing protein [Amycolatopsis arida]
MVGRSDNERAGQWADQREARGTTLRQLLVAVGEPLVDLDVPASGLDAPVRGVAILDPDDAAGGYPDELVLVVGARGRAAVRPVRAAAAGGATAVAVKVDRDGDVATLRAAAADVGVALLAVRPKVRWEQLETLVREVLEGAELAAGQAGADDPADLFALAQTVAVLTGGIVSIEDAGNRVLAYSRSDEHEVDELRRLSILGWRGPESYLAMLRRWGVYQRLRAGEEVVHVAEHPEHGIRRRLAVGIRAGAHHLGVIWVQEGREAFAERAESVLLGAARTAAGYLLRHRVELAPGRHRRDLAAALLAGQASADLVAGQLGLDPGAPAVVVAFGGPAGPDQSAGELHRVETLNVVAVHAAAYRRAALVGALGRRVYAVLPDVPARRVEPALTALAEEVVDVLRRRTGGPVRAGIGAPVGTLGEVPESRADADRVLDVMGRDRARWRTASPFGPWGETGGRVATIADLRAEVLLGETLALLADRPDLRDPGVAALTAHDAEHGTELAPSLLAYLDALGDVRSAAAAVHVHPNTLRYRVRRAAAVGEIELADPAQRLFCHLQLLLAARA